QIQPADVAVGLQRARRQAALMGQMLQPGGQSVLRSHGGGAQASSGHRSAMRSTTRATKATSSQPMAGVKPSSSPETKAHRAARGASSPGAFRLIRTRAT